MQRIEAGVRRIVAPNPSPMTGAGTCCYVVGTGSVAVIDPGPEDPAHIRALLEGLDAHERVGAIFVTHAHLDHSPGARLLAAETGAPVYGFGPATVGRTPIMERLAAEGAAGGGEGVDRAFAPDRLMTDGETAAMGDWRLRALHTPGHFGNHLAFAYGDLIFTGDVVMGWSSTLISPPDGDLGDYYRSLDRIGAEGARRLLPGHGEAVDDPAGRIAELIQHRRDRSAQILSLLARAPATPGALTRAIYDDLAPRLQGAAARNVFAHLVELTREGQVRAEPRLAPDATFQLA